MSTTPSATPSGVFRIGGDIPVHRLGYGAMRITGDGIWGQPRDRDEALRVLRRLPELGVDFIDTADSYGPFVSEDLIAEALAPYPGMLVATKGGLARTGPDLWPPLGLASEPFDELVGVADLGLGLGEGLAVLQRQQGPQSLGVTVDQLAPAAQDGGALELAHAGPAREGVGDGLHCGLDLASGELGDGAEHRLLGRILDLDAAGALDPFAGDQRLLADQRLSGGPGGFKFRHLGVIHGGLPSQFWAF